MIDKDDIRAAVGSGLLTEGQAASLTALAHSRKGAREDLSAGDEPFELFRGFNEVFIIVGLCILAAGWAGIVGWAVADRLETWRATSVLYTSITVGLIWLLSEYFIRRRRMVGPAMLLTCLFALTAFLALGQQFGQIYDLVVRDYSTLVLPALLTAGAVFVFWLRFRVPFAMAVIALGLFAAALLAAANSTGAPTGLRDIFTLSADSRLGWVTLALGIVTFVIAMVFDGSDPHRVTRRSSQGFWLHLVAAPMIINTVALSLFAGDTATSYTVLLIVMAVFAAIAIIIDRRSFLLAAISYVVAVLMTVSPVTETASGPLLILGLGVFLVVLGAFWARIRALLLTALPLGGLRDYLPPAH